MSTRTTTKPLNDCYMPVRITGSVRIHALWEHEDKTMCGHVQVLDVEGAEGYSVGCSECQAALKKERQRRSAEGVARGEERRLAAHYRAEDERAVSEQEQHAAWIAAQSALISVKEQAGAEVAKRIIRMASGLYGTRDQTHVKMVALLGDADKCDLAFAISTLVLDMGVKAMEPAMALTATPPVYKPGTPLFTIIEGGVARGFRDEQIIAEAKASGFDIESKLIEAVARDFNARMDRDLKPMGVAEKHALSMAVAMVSGFSKFDTHFGKTVMRCRHCSAIKAEDVPQWTHDDGCPINLADQVIENYGGGQ